MIEQWQELKETIIEMRDNDGIGTQQEACKFLADLMDVLEKQMQEPCEDAISRDAVLEQAWTLEYPDSSSEKVVSVKDIEKLPPVTQSRPKGHWIYEGAGYCHCSVCETSRYGTENFCPKCGAENGE